MAGSDQSRLLQWLDRIGMREAAECGNTGETLQKLHVAHIEVCSETVSHCHIRGHIAAATTWAFLQGRPASYVAAC
jgi:hypothetical protein